MSEITKTRKEDLVKMDKIELAGLIGFVAGLTVGAVLSGIIIGVLL